MSLPSLNANGDLPLGVHATTLLEIEQRFGTGSKQRELVFDRLRRIRELAASTGRLVRFAVFGSFVTNEPHPNDVDVVLVMDDEFDLASVDAQTALVFDHMSADAHFGASIFWSTRSGALGGEQAMIEYWQTWRDGGLRGIVEIVGEPG